MFPFNDEHDSKIAFGTEGTPSSEEQPFYILLLGDWSGKRADSSQKAELNSRLPIEIDRDNFDKVLNKLNVGTDLVFPGDNKNFLSLRFKEIDDFHPDKIFQQIPLFADLRDIRRRLMNSETFNKAAIEVRSWYFGNEAEKVNNAESHTFSNSESEISQKDLLSEILFQTDENVIESKSQTAESSELSVFIKKIVNPHLIQIDTVEQSDLLMVVDEVISDLMRKILHHPEFQALESAWRGVYFLVRRIETNADLKIYLLDISKGELAKNLKNVDNLEDSLLFQIVNEEGGKFPSNESFAVIGGNYTFSPTVEDTAILARIAKIAHSSNTPFISHTTPELFGFSSFGGKEIGSDWKVREDSVEYKLWTFLRQMPEATALALALPRFLARMPYGDKTDPIEAFFFEEVTEYSKHELYLWSNPIFINVLLLAQTFSVYGWNIPQNFFQEVVGMPIFIYQDEYENKTKPCAEMLITQIGFEKIIEQGLTHLISFRDSDKIRVAQLRSIASSATFLEGKWS